MNVKELIELLSELDGDLNVYLSSNEVDAYFYKVLDVGEVKGFEGENIVSIFHRN